MTTTSLSLVPIPATLRSEIAHKYGFSNDNRPLRIHSPLSSSASTSEMLSLQRSINCSPLPLKPKTRPTPPTGSENADSPPKRPHLQILSFQGFVNEKLPLVASLTKTIQQLSDYKVNPKFIRYALIYFRGDEEKALAFIQDGELADLGLDVPEDLLYEMEREYSAYRDERLVEEASLVKQWEEQMKQWEVYHKELRGYTLEQEYITYWKDLLHRFHHGLDREIWMHLFGFLELQDVLICRTIWKQWYAMLNGNTFWDRIVHERCTQKEIQWMVKHAASNVLVQSNMRDLFCRALEGRKPQPLAIESTKESEASEIHVSNDNTTPQTPRTRGISFGKSLKIALGVLPSPREGRNSARSARSVRPRTPRASGPFNCANLLSKNTDLIIDYLNEDDLFTCRLVCTHWAEYLSIESSPMWKQLTWLRFEEFRDILRKTSTNTWRDVYKSYAMIRLSTMEEPPSLNQSMADMSHLLFTLNTSTNGTVTERDSGERSFGVTESTHDSISEWESDQEESPDEMTPEMMNPEENVQQQESTLQIESLSLEISDKDSHSSSDGSLAEKKVSIEPVIEPVLLHQQEDSSSSSTERSEGPPHHDADIIDDTATDMTVAHNFNGSANDLELIEIRPLESDLDEERNSQTSQQLSDVFNNSFIGEQPDSESETETETHDGFTAPTFHVSHTNVLNSNDILSAWNAAELNGLTEIVTFGTMDEEILTGIFAFLPVRSWKHCRLVCVHWYSASLSDNFFYKNVILNLFENDVHWTEECSTLSVKQWQYVLSNMKETHSFRDTTAAEWAQELGFQQFESQSGMQEEFERHISDALQMIEEASTGKRKCCVVC